MRTIECGNCLRYRGDLTCDAYPGWIPERILTGQVSHRGPQPGDHGKTFFEIPGEPFQKADGGPFMGPRGGKYEDAALTIPWKESADDRPKTHKQAIARAVGALKRAGFHAAKLNPKKGIRVSGFEVKKVANLVAFEYSDWEHLGDQESKTKAMVAALNQAGINAVEATPGGGMFKLTWPKKSDSMAKGERISANEGAMTSPAGNRAPAAGGSSGANHLFPTPEHKPTLEVEQRGMLRPALEEYSTGKSARGMYRDKAIYDMHNAEHAVEAKPVILAIPIEIIEGARDDVEYRRARVDAEVARRSRKLEPNRRPVSLEDDERKKKRKGKTDGTARSPESRAEVKEPKQ